MTNAIINNQTTLARIFNSNYKKDDTVSMRVTLETNNNWPFIRRCIQRDGYKFGLMAKNLNKSDIVEIEEIMQFDGYFSGVRAFAFYLDIMLDHLTGENLNLVFDIGVSPVEDISSDKIRATLSTQKFGEIKP